MPSGKCTSSGKPEKEYHVFNGHSVRMSISEYLLPDRS